MNNVIRNKMTKDNSACLLICLLIFVLTFLCSPFSPLYRYCFGQDEICYSVLAKGLLNGKVPYRDLFDHKGPLTYFIYALGYLVSTKTHVGVCILLALINSLIYIVAYKTLRLYFDEEKSLFTLLIFITLIGCCKANILSTMSKPENILMLPIMLSAYVLLKNCRTASNADEYILKRSKIYLIGLMCGCVFLIKLNFCIYYLCFIGLYFIWLLVKKYIKDFFVQVILFIAGIITINVPILAFYYFNSALKSMFDVYIMFNITYSGRGKPFGLNYLGGVAKLAGIVFLLLLAGGFAVYLLRKKYEKQDIVMYMASLVVILFVLSPSMTLAYTIIVLMPIMFFGISWLTNMIVDCVNDDKTINQISIMIAIILCINLSYQFFYLVPNISKEKTEFENHVESFAEIHPDAEYMFLGSICQPIYYDLTSSQPSFRIFYLPPLFTEEVFSDELNAVKMQMPDAIVIPYGGIHSNISGQLQEFVVDNGYVIYAEDFRGENNGFYLYVRADDPILVT
ncbi:MAG: glycosyltransferase family 39 protein [Clostridia bacterium]|nr:glycosyltransferase family 39 protein [Clostridia bacterium]